MSRSVWFYGSLVATVVASALTTAGDTQACAQGSGFYTFTSPQPGTPIYAVYYNNTPKSYCWVIDPGELDAIHVSNAPQGWPGGSFYDSLFASCTPTIVPTGAYCPWPNGLFVRDNKVYYIKGAVQGTTTMGKACHVLNNTQVNLFGGSGQVWRPGEASDQFKFEIGVSNAGHTYNYSSPGSNVPDCTNSGPP